MEETNVRKQPLFVLSLLVLVIFLLLVTGLYFWVSKKTKSQTVFPAGVNYLGPQTATPAPTIDISQVGKSGKWLKAAGKVFKYEFIYPAELQIAAFINDSTDKMAWVTGLIPPQQNVFINVEKMSDLDPKYIGQPEEFVKNFWKKFNGLSGVKSYEAVTNQKGLKGYKIIYLAKTGEVANTNYFFPVPNDNNHILQVINGIIPESVFNNIVNSIEFK